MTSPFTAERMIVALRRLGAQQNDAPLTKWHRYNHLTKPGFFYYVHPDGALKVGETLQKAIRISDIGKESLLERGGIYVHEQK